MRGTIGVNRWNRSGLSTLLFVVLATLLPSAARTSLQAQDLDPLPQRTPAEAIQWVKARSLEPTEAAATALVEAYADWKSHPDVVQELEWGLVAMGTLALGPMAQAVEQEKIPAGLVLTVLSRLSRRFPAEVGQMVSRGGRGGHLALVALVGSASPEASEVLRSLFPELPADTQCTALELLCAARSRECAPLLSRGLRSQHRPLVLLSLEWTGDRRQMELVQDVVPLLSSEDGEIARAALDAARSLGASNFLGELKVLYEESRGPRQIEILSVLASDPTQEVLAYLGELARNLPERSAVGRAARDLLRAAVGGRIWTGSAAQELPVEAIFFPSSEQHCQMLLRNDLGFRVRSAGTLFVGRGGKVQEQRLTSDDFSSDGLVTLPGLCDAHHPPVVRFRRSDGAVISAGWDAEGTGL